MTDTTATQPPPPHRRRPARSRKAPASWRTRRRLAIPRRGIRRAARPEISADLALRELMSAGDVFQVGRRRYLVAPIDADLLELLIWAAGIVEDDEEDDPGGGNVEDTGELEEPEDDGLGDGMYGGECALIAEPEDQTFMRCSADEDEHSLGWSNIGSQLRLHAADEGDGDCDAEEDDPSGDPLDKGEFDPCDLGEPENYLDG